MTPYYDDGQCVIYHGDCREILPTLEFDVIVTDPPYGIGLDTKRTNKQPSRDKRGAIRTGRDHAAVVGDDVPFDPTPFLQRAPCGFTGANYFPLPGGGRWHVWDKTGGGLQPTGLNNEFEIIWTSYPSGRGVVLRILWAGMHRVNNHPDSFNHPTTKPVQLMQWMIQKAPPGTVLDPFMGSGTTLRAAKDLSRKAIGIEIEERYCEIAAKRLAQGVLDFGESA